MKENENISLERKMGYAFFKLQDRDKYGLPNWKIEGVEILLQKVGDLKL